ncbi:hypothetical protein NTE_01673 [Candidatus Nitrososphaera evergladensis SR1]|jgi:hypothetical protein|uniref:PRC-barrel domain-containing protein n=1 Tax=Candidatus Nitrososphaera evergladensis SR1 TaxID=1459636 RepID=A0A075MWU8_9ARCH|nr:hypothetical protein [Candidatus Nitrososphaera evergladensis]AIF83734.1 hypothetical protein NTE_01673 [Candidatus Nitrososphaera evergladensis SR1]
MSKNKLDYVEWNELKGKEARGVDKSVDLGEIQGVGRTYVVTKKGVVDKDKFYIPKALAERYDGKEVWFNVSEGMKSEFRRDNPPSDEEYAKYRTTNSPTDIEDKIAVVTEIPVKEDAVVVESETMVDTGIQTEEQPVVVDWEKIIHKNVRSMDGEPVGNVVALYPDTIHVESQGSRMAYEIPKDEVKGFDGAEVRLKAPITDLERYMKRGH